MYCMELSKGLDPIYFSSRKRNRELQTTIISKSSRTINISCLQEVHGKDEFLLGYIPGTGSEILDYLLPFILGQ